MSDPYIGEIRLFGGNFAPVGWEFCHGQGLPISQYETLFALIGTTYGGDGWTTFQLPDLRGRVPVHQGTASNSGSNRVIGESGGQETVILTVQQLPQHTHAVLASPAEATSRTAVGNLRAELTSGVAYAEVGPAVRASVPMADTSVAGTNPQPHENRQPYLAVNYIIATEGVFPTRN